MSYSSRKGKSKASSVAESFENPYVTQIRPPSRENSIQRSQRVRSMQDAQALSRRIDDDLAESKKWLDRRKKALKILLLG